MTNHSNLTRTTVGITWRGVRAPTFNRLEVGSLLPIWYRSEFFIEPVEKILRGGLIVVVTGHLNLIGPALAPPGINLGYGLLDQCVVFPSDPLVWITFDVAAGNALIASRKSTRGCFARRDDTSAVAFCLYQLDGCQGIFLSDLVFGGEARSARCR